MLPLALYHASATNSSNWACPIMRASSEKINVTRKPPVGDISVVTLIRTDTTLDHSQKAEKVYHMQAITWHKINFYFVYACVNEKVAQIVSTCSAVHMRTVSCDTSALCECPWSSARRTTLMRRCAPHACDEFLCVQPKQRSTHHHGLRARARISAPQPSAWRAIRKIWYNHSRAASCEILTRPSLVRLVVQQLRLISYQPSIVLGMCKCALLDARPLRCENAHAQVHVGRLSWGALRPMRAISFHAFKKSRDPHPIMSHTRESAH